MTEAIGFVPEQNSRGEELPIDILLRELDALACEWGGEDYRNGVDDGVEIKRKLRLRGDESSTGVTFTADRIREDEESDEYFTIYTIKVEVSREIELGQMPAHAYDMAIALYEKKDLIKRDFVKEEKHLVLYTIRDDIKDLEYELEVSYLVDDDEVFSISTEDSTHGNEEDDDEPEDIDCSVATLPQLVYDHGKEIEPEEPGKPDASEEAGLLNEAWEVIGSAEAGDTPFELGFDPDMLIKMAKIQRRLDKENTKLWRLMSLARCEMQEMQIQQCRAILKKFRPGSLL